MSSEEFHIKFKCILCCRRFCAHKFQIETVKLQELGFFVQWSYLEVSQCDICDTCNNMLDDIFKMKSHINDMRDNLSEFIAMCPTECRNANINEINFCQLCPEQVTFKSGVCLNQEFDQFASVLSRDIILLLLKIEMEFVYAPPYIVICSICYGKLLTFYHFFVTVCSTFLVDVGLEWMHSYCARNAGAIPLVQKYPSRSYGLTEHHPRIRITDEGEVVFLDYLPPIVDYGLRDCDADNFSKSPIDNSEEHVGPLTSHINVDDYHSDSEEFFDHDLEDIKPPPRSPSQLPTIQDLVKHGDETECIVVTDSRDYPMTDPLKITSTCRWQRRRRFLSKAVKKRTKKPTSSILFCMVCTKPFYKRQGWLTHMRRVHNHSINPAQKCTVPFRNQTLHNEKERHRRHSLRSLLNNLTNTIYASGKLSQAKIIDIAAEVINRLKVRRAQLAYERNELIDHNHELQQRLRYLQSCATTNETTSHMHIANVLKEHSYVLNEQTDDVLEISISSLPDATDMMLSEE